MAKVLLLGILMCMIVVARFAKAQTIQIQTQAQWIHQTQAQTIF